MTDLGDKSSAGHRLAVRLFSGMFQKLFNYSSYDLHITSTIPDTLNLAQQGASSSFIH